MAKHHVRIDFDDVTNKTDIQSTTGNEWVDLQIIMEGLALSMAVNRKNRKVNAEALSEYVKTEIFKIANSKNNYTTKDRTNRPPPGSFLLRP